MLEIKEISKLYRIKHKTVAAIDQLNLTVDKGEFLCVLGLSGSGKTTLVSMLGGIDHATEGSFVINENDTKGFSEKDWTNYRKNNIGFVFQEFHLIDHLTAVENIEIALSLSGKSTLEQRNEAMSLLELVGMSHRSNQRPNELSGGEKQRVAIARALANKPEIILADEPTGALDPDTAHKILALLQSLVGLGHTVIMVTHDRRLARAYASRMIELESGSIIRDERLKDHLQYDSETLSKTKSILPFRSAFKIAFNNLKLRKKSTLLTFITLVPSIVFIIFLMTMLMNLMDFNEELKPLTYMIHENDSVLYLAPLNDNELDGYARRTMDIISRKNFREERVNEFRDYALEPYAKDVIGEIERIEGVEAVLNNTYFDLVINNERFTAITLPPEDFADYNKALSSEQYPGDQEKGLIFSEEAASRFNASLKVGDPIEMSIFAKDGVGYHIDTWADKKNSVTSQVLNIISAKSQSHIMKDYFAGYVFISSGYSQELEDLFDKEDYSIVSYEIILPPMSGIAPPTRLETIGPQNISDPLWPLRDTRLTYETFQLFSFRRWELYMPANNYTIKKPILINENFDEDSLETLESYGLVSLSILDEESSQIAERTKDYLEYAMIAITVLSAIIILIPTLLVGIILYISIMIRIKEIGVLKSIGARRVDILKIFTLESGIVATLSVLLANLIALPLLYFSKEWVNRVYQVEAFVGMNPLSYNVYGFLIAGIIGVLLVTLVGALPGYKASRLNPNQLLKHL